MPKEHLTPIVDVAFKKIFGVPENKDLLISLLNSIVSEKDQIADLHLLNPYNPQNFKKDKSSILDIKAQSHTGKYYNIEIQLFDETSYSQRILFYWSKLYTGQLVKGMGYGKLNKTISIHILNFINIPEIPKYHNTFHICEKETKAHYFEDFEIHIIELNKFEPNEVNHKLKDADRINLLMKKVKTSLDRWVAFLTRHELLIQLPALQDLKIQKALEVLNVMNFTEEEREAYEGHLKWLRAEADAVEKAENKGLEKGLKRGRSEGEQRGIEKGRAESIEKVIISLLSQGIDIDIIAKSTGMPNEFIANFKITKVPEIET